ncbi:reverse transcriptase domain-containing protein [Tanacetum coccineum]
MSTNEQNPLSQPTSVMRNTLGKEPVLQDLGTPISDEALREYYDRNYHHILPIIAEKVHQEKVQQEKLKAVKACLNFEEASHQSELGTPIKRRDLKERLRPKNVRGRSRSPEPRHGHYESPKKKGPERKAVFKRLEKGVFHRLGDKGNSVSVHSDDSRRVITREHPQEEQRSCQKVKAAMEVIGNPFTPRIRYFDFPKARMPSHIKTYDGSEDPEDHLKIFQSAAKTERWAMPTWCHMFNSTLTGNATAWFDDLPKETIDSYDDLKKAFLENYFQQKKCIKDPVKIHNIWQRDGESMEEFVPRYKLECRDVKGALKCMKISRFMHRITNPELIKRLHDKIPKSVDEITRVTTTFLRGEVAASNRARKKSFPSWKQQEAKQKQNFKKGGFQNQQRSERKQDRFTLLTKTPKEIFALDKGKFKALPPMTTLVEKRNHAKFYEFHGKLQKYEQPKVTKKGETSGKDKALAILMVQPWERMGKYNYVTIETKNHIDTASAWMNFVVVRSPSPYNGIIGRPRFRKLYAIPSTAHGMLKIPVEGGVITLKAQVGSARMARCVHPDLECNPIGYQANNKRKGQSSNKSRVSETNSNDCSTHTEEGRNKLCGLLQRNLYIFAWKPADITSVPRYIAEHRLNVWEGCSPVRQKKRGQAADRNQAIQEEVGKLVEAGIMKEVHYHDWLSNPVMDATKAEHQIPMQKEKKKKQHILPKPEK